MPFEEYRVDGYGRAADGGVLMKEYMVDAIVLKSVRAREADRILTLFTRQEGKKRVIAHGVEKPSSRKRGAVQPFSRSRLLLRRGRDLDSVSQGEGLDMFPAIRRNLDSLSKASYMAELVDAFMQDEDPHPGVYDLIGETYSLLGGSFDFILARAFEIKLVSLLGYRPALDFCVMCGGGAAGPRVFFSPAQGGVVCAGCGPESGNTMEITRGTLENIKTLLRWEMGHVSRLVTGPAAGREIKAVMKAFIEYRLERGIRSAAFEEMVDRGPSGGK
ncbi:MAG: DNA repair protein RecO [Bacillota bacterium]